MRQDVESKKLYFGFVAQEMQELYPESVWGRSMNYAEDGTYIGKTEVSSSQDPEAMAVNYYDIISVLTLMVQHGLDNIEEVEGRVDVAADKIVREQGARVHDQVRRIAALRHEIDQLRKTQDKSITRNVDRAMAKLEVDKTSQTTGTTSHEDRIDVASSKVKKASAKRDGKDSSSAGRESRQKSRAKKEKSRE
jgi:hypothetical protein